MKETKQKKRESLKYSFLAVTLIPIVTMTIFIVIFTSNRTVKAIENEEKEGMANIACLYENIVDKAYPGDYELMVSDKYLGLFKGGVALDIMEDLEAFKADTGIDITFFFLDTRMITTIEGGQGTTCNYLVKKDVLEKDKEGFYSNVKVGNEVFYAYYKPLHNSDGKVVGMIAVLKSAEEIDGVVNRTVLPIYVISFIVMIVAGAVSIFYCKRFVTNFNSIKKCLVAIENDNYSVELDNDLKKRKDELGEMADAVVSMRGVIKKYTEMDGLTNIFNRRYAQKRLVSLIESVKISGGSYALCIADIDFFKKVNDNYGHDAGDMVLIKVAYELKRFMQGKGFVARWGGEEFLLVYEKGDMDAFLVHLEELRKTIQELRFSFDENKQVTMSFGVAQDENLSGDELIKLADNRLYIAKENGRNQIVYKDE